MINSSAVLTTRSQQIKVTTGAIAKVVAAALIIMASSAASAQDVRYSWFEIAFVAQDIDKGGFMQSGVPGQTVSADTSDGTGIRFRGSVGVWHNLFAFVDFNSSDIDVAAVVTNSQGQFPTKDEFDFTSIRGGIGYRWPVTFKTDLYAAVSFDGTNFDFGSFAGENFDASDSDVGATFGVRSMIGDKLELRAHARYSRVDNIRLSGRDFDDDTLFGVGFGYELVRGLSITGDYESGELSSWSIGFRLDLDED